MLYKKHVCLKHVLNMFFNACVQKTRIQLFLVMFIYSDSHFQYKLGFFWYEWSSLKRSFHSRFKGPRVPKKTQFTHEGPDFKLTCDGRTCGCHGHVAKEKDDAYW
jgi:hypothetical protein